MSTPLSGRISKNHASAQSVERTTLNRVSSQKTGTGRGFDPQTSLKLDIHRVLYCPVMWLRFFLLFFASRTPPLRFSTKTGSAGSREGPHLSERTPHSLVPDRTHNPARQEIRQGYGEGRPRLPYARETSRRPTRASHDCGPEGKEARGGADARAKLGVAPRVPRHASMGLDRTTDRGPRPRQCDSKVRLPSTTERSTDPPHASQAPRRLRPRGSRKKIDKAGTA